MDNQEKMNEDKRGKNALVTVGTTRFDELVTAITTSLATDWLICNGFTSLTIQYGTGSKPDTSNLESLPLSIQAYDFTPSLHADMQQADLVLSHAGAGTVMEALKLQRKLVVVINTRLMNNHQTELAEAMAERGHLFMVERPEDLSKPDTWTRFHDFNPIPHEGGNNEDFPRLLNNFFGFGATKMD
eukprot:Nitzschia sp. Nitz4//scaffold1_size375055//252798//253355//NITZ4_000298-RA/size375055-processed-gene-0.147-mRNA-1//-1//CDS//3329541111//5464//frame0